jgi:hypothetical protein
MWTTENRSRYDRSKLRYPSDLTAEEWQRVEPLIPPGKRGGGKRTVVMRKVVNTSVRYVFCLIVRTTLILLVSRVSRLTWTRKRINAVRHANSVFHDILKLVPWATFDRLVGEFGTDDWVRCFTTRDQFHVLLFAQLGGASSLREVEAVMASHQARLYHAGAKAPKRSTLADAVREIVVETETGKRLRILTNDLDAPAQEIADLYKRRWQIELFFRVMKQTLKITKFLGRSENAVRIQIAVALIAFLLLRILQELTKAKHGFLELARLVRANLTHRKDVSRLRDNVPAPPIDSRQLLLNLETT